MSQPAESRLDQWVSALGVQGLNLTPDEVADACWLALVQHRFGVEQPGRPNEPASAPLPVRSLPASDMLPALPPAPELPIQQSTAPKAELYPRGTALPRREAPTPVRLPAAKVLRDPLSLVRALRPLMQQRAIGQGTQLDEAATVRKIAEERVWWPVTQPLTENWLELAIVVDENASMLVWRRTVEALHRLLKHYGIFRDVRLWGLVAQPEVLIRPRPFSPVTVHRLRQPEGLVEPTGRRVILLVSDCVGDSWQSPLLMKVLRRWGQHNPLVLLQMMPEWMWPRTQLRQAMLMSLRGKTPAQANQSLEVVAASTAYRRRPLRARRADIKLPVITLESDRMAVWARMIAVGSPSSAPGMVFAAAAQPSTLETVQRLRPQDVSATTAAGRTANDRTADGRTANGRTEHKAEQSPERQVQAFRSRASPLARRLASLLAASPAITLQTIRIVQAKMLPQSEQVHIAEVLLGGLLQPVKKSTPSRDPDDMQYEFISLAVRSALLAEAPVTDTTQVLSDYIEEKYQGVELDEFIADLYRQMLSGRDLDETARPIAVIAAEVLQYQGRKHVNFVTAMQQRDRPQPPSEEIALPPTEVFPPLEPFDFIDAQLVDTGATFPPPLQTEAFTVVTFEDDAPDGLELFDFDVVTLQRRSRIFRADRWEIQRQQQQAYRLTEVLPDNVSLEVVAIPAGTFVMGSPSDEPERYDYESPQHEVSVKPFFMGRYPVTQAQWRAVAGLPQVERELEAEPARFKGDLRPVEQVSWYDAVEFCARLSAHTGREYRLPTEAEWEYACRAGTTTPFHFGDMITTDVANYNGSAYKEGPKGTRRGETTPVDQCDCANAFGLSDMHGNVWEWCADHWHSNYEGAPVDGSAWLTDDEEARRVIRGGAWYSFASGCRSAFRGSDAPGNRDVIIGFRVSCSAPRTQ